MTSDPRPLLTTTWHTLSPELAAKSLESDLLSGLPETEAAARLQRWGRNELEARAGRTLLQMLADQFRDVMIWVLLAAVVISLVVGETTDALVIVAIILLNAVLGVVQESKAERSLEALKQLSAPHARVVRGAQTRDVPAAEVVPGDLVLLEAGSFVPADLRLTDSADLRVEEASLTGESEPVRKRAEAVLAEEAPLGDRCNLAFAGTVVVHGRGAGLVTATGSHTQVGDIARLLGEIDEGKTPLQARLEQLGRTLAVSVLGICALVFAAGLLRGFPPLELFLTSVSLAVAAIPEGLPAVVTIVLAVGMSNMVRRNVITRRLRAVETLGSTTLICTDKTGTLTQNQMTVRRFWVAGREGTVTGVGYAPEGQLEVGDAAVDPRDPVIRRLLEVGALCNDAALEFEEGQWRAAGDPTEAALLALAGKGGLDRVHLDRALPRRAELPFDSERKRMSTLHATPDGRILVAVKGAPESLLDCCSRILAPEGPRELNEEDRRQVELVNGSFANAALRVLGVAYRELPSLPATVSETEIERDLVLVGLVGIIDPPREEAREAVRVARAAGIRPVMITGDHAVTARAIARELEMSTEDAAVLTGVEISQLDEEQLRARSPEVAVYARVSPADKLRIVDAYQTRGHVVAMTGDGVNDGPALKKADVGVAMGRTGTDVARGAADIVLTDDNFASIVAAVEEGRRIFDNIRKFVFYLLSCNVSEILTLLIAVLLGLPQPLLPVQLLWLNLVTDGLPALALGLEPQEPDSMRRPPRDPREGVLTRKTVRGILWYGAYMTGATLAAYLHGLYWLCLVPQGHTGPAAFAAALHPENWQQPQLQEGLQVARTMAFGTLAFCQLVHALNSRSARRSLFSLGLFTNRALLAAIAISALAQVLVINTPWGNRLFETLPVIGRELAVAVVLSASPLVFGELRKWLLRRMPEGDSVLHHGDTETRRLHGEGRS